MARVSGLIGAHPICNLTGAIEWAQIDRSFPHLFLAVLSHDFSAVLFSRAPDDRSPVDIFFCVYTSCEPKENDHE
jgi:hypothetical protein